MKRKSFMAQKKLLPIVWSGIILGFIYLLVRFTVISFSSDVGQANGSLKETLLTKLYINVMESGSSFLEYIYEGEEDAFSFPISLVTDEFVLYDFITDNSPKLAMAQENTISFNDELLINSFAQENADYTETKVFDDEIKENQKQSMDFYEITNGVLSKEYIMTNGALLGNLEMSEGLLAETINNISNNNQLQIGILDGDVTRNETDEKSTAEEKEEVVEAVKTDSRLKFTLKQLKNPSVLIQNFYIVDQDTKVVESLFDAEEMLSKDMTIKQKNDKPQILIYHTHSQEAFIDSKPDEESDTVVGVGTYLTKVLEEQYGYNVIHDKSCYDVVDGVWDRNKAYNYARDGINKILEENPSIEVVIDLHRDGAPKRSIMINGEETAQIMLFNGLCRDQEGPLTRLENPYLKDNLSFSLQLQMKSLELYPGLFYKNYLHAYRYNLHVRQKSILMELGTDYNSLQSAKNAMPLFAQILDSVLKGK
jgi:stage II sporulation protein P